MVRIILSIVISCMLYKGAIVMFLVCDKYIIERCRLSRGGGVDRGRAGCGIKGGVLEV